MYTNAMEMEKELTIQEVAERTGLSVHTLRYYEKIGLLARVERAESSGHRRYNAADLDWLALMLCLRDSGMGIKQMQEYAILCRQGDEAGLDRLHFLQAHRQQVIEHIQDLQNDLAVIEKKIKRLTEKFG